jgi:uncharacterized protein (DUF952 family)
MAQKRIYKILRPAEWAHLNEAGYFAGSPDDLRDGFIHFSTLEQLPGTLVKYYTDGEDVFIAAVAESAFTDSELVYEASRGGALFPHLYADLSQTQIVQFWQLSADADGVYDISGIGSHA